jgi:WhiB family transcriptional regulator, redox-sensing transcriptional regulator
MSRKEIKRNQVDWDKANCKGINTDIFFLAPGEYEGKEIERKVLRRVCARCPIRQECLEVAVAYQEEGYWGCLTEQERRYILKRKFNTEIMESLKKDLGEVGLELSDFLFILQVKKKQIWGQYAN